MPLTNIEAVERHPHVGDVHHDHRHDRVHIHLHAYSRGHFRSIIEDVLDAGYVPRRLNTPEDADGLVLVASPEDDVREDDQRRFITL